MNPKIGITYTLTENRGAATVTAIVDRHRVMVQFADGSQRKVSNDSLMATADHATPAPAPASRREANERKHEEERFAARLKEQIRIEAAR